MRDATRRIVIDKISPDNSCHQKTERVVSLLVDVKRAQLMQ